MKKKILSLHQIRAARKPLKNVNVEHKNALSKLETLALWITEHIGTMGFFFIIFVWTICWLSWNMIQIFLMPLIMIGQNLQGKHSELRAQSDFEVNVKAEKEIEVIIQHLENHEELLKEILGKIR
jgi:uncharacterized membrane protein